MKTRRILALALCAVMVLMTACNPGSGGSTAPVESTPPAESGSASEGGEPAAPSEGGGLEDATISILTRSFNDNSTPWNNAALEALNEWMAANPNITVENESVHDEDQFNNKFKIAVSSGEMPTMVSSYGGGAFKVYVESGLILDLEPYFGEYADFFGSFNELSYSTMRYTDIPGTYGVASDMFATGVFYNKTIFAELGIDPPKTIAEFEAACQTLLDNGYQAMPLGDKNAYLGGHLIGDVLMKRFGSDIMFQLADREKSYTDDDVVEIFSLMKEWQDKGFLGENVVTLDQENQRTMFRNGESGMIHHLAHNYTPIMDGGTVSDDEVGFLLFPYFEEYPEHQNAMHSGTNGNYSISADASDAEIAAMLDFWKVMFGEDSMTRAAMESKGTFMPCVENITQPTDIPPASQDFQNIYASVTDIGKEPGEYDTNPAIRNMLRDQIQAMFAGTSPEDVAAILQNEIDSN